MHAVLLFLASWTLTTSRHWWLGPDWPAIVDWCSRSGAARTPSSGSGLRASAWGVAFRRVLHTCPGQLAGGLQSVHHRHADVHEYHGGSSLPGEGDSLPAVLRLADDVDVGFAVEQPSGQRLTPTGSCDEAGRKENRKRAAGTARWSSPNAAAGTTLAPVRQGDTDGMAMLRKQATAPRNVARRRGSGRPSVSRPRRLPGWRRGPPSAARTAQALTEHLRRRPD